MIQRWNNVVGHNDHVFHLGDFSFAGPDRTIDLIYRLNGVKHLIAGNHDAKHRKNQKFVEAFQFVVDYHEMTVQDDELPEHKQHIVLCHYPIMSWNKARYGSWHLHGHCHGTVKSPGVKRYDVGVDPNNFVPLCYTELKAIFAKCDNVDGRPKRRT